MNSPRNMLVYAATEAEFLNPVPVDDSMRRIREAGFQSVYLEFRNVRAPRLGARFQAGMAAMVAAARRAGLSVALEAAFNNLDDELKEEAPEVFTDTLNLHELKIEGGELRFEVEGDPSCWSVEYAARPRNGGYETVALPEPQILIEGGGCAMTAHPSRSRAAFVWKIAGGDGPLILVSRRKFDYSFKDLSHPELHRRLSKIVESRMACAPDELYWDEPHFGFAFYDNNGRAISDHLLETFSERFGYRLESRYPDLWIDRPGAVQVRIHYSELLEAALAGLEKMFVDCVRGSSSTVTLGGHRTMHEELSDDSLIGCGDYFRHDAATTASYSDSVFEREDSMITMAHLARSMAAAVPGRQAWNMSWGFRPTPAQQKFYIALLGAMNVRWCGHAWNDTMMFGPGFPHHPCWENVTRDLSVHDALIGHLKDAQIVADTWVVYNWRAPLGQTGAHRHTHRRSLMLLCKQLAYAGRQLRIVDPENLPEPGPAGVLKRIIVPWPDLLPAGFWAKISAQSGVDIAVFGPPPRCDAEGNTVSLPGVEFAESRELRIGDSIRAFGASFDLAPGKIQSGWDDSPAVTLPEVYPVFAVLAEGAEVLGQSGGAAVGIRTHIHGVSVTLFTVELPLFPGLLQKLLNLPGCDGLLRFRYETRGRLLEASVVCPGSQTAIKGDRIFWMADDGSAAVSELEN